MSMLLHGTPAELEPGDLIKPNTYPPSHPEDPSDLTPREHTYLSDRRAYLTEYYGPNLYEVEPTGQISHDPEYDSRRMWRSRAPLRVIRKVSQNWGEDVPADQN